MNAAGDPTAVDDVPSTPLQKIQSQVEQKLLVLRDKSSPHVIPRWACSGCFALFYFFRVWYLQGFYIVTYALGIYLVNLLIGFITPQFDPEVEGSLPTSGNDEFKPFMRRLPEYKFWYSVTKALLVAFFCTFFSAFNIPVFWPILLIYFCVLFFATMRRQIQHMIKHRYVPWNVGKKKFAGKTEAPAVPN